MMKNMNRRTFLLTSGVALWVAGCGSSNTLPLDNTGTDAGTGTGSGAASGSGSGSGDGAGSGSGTGSQVTTLPIPALLSGQQFDLSLRQGSQQFISGLTTPTYGINGDFLGPALKVRRGDSITLNVTNNLPEVTTLHWHGMHVPGGMDGGPHQVIQPGQSWKAQFTVNQKAATNWFHPHTHGETGRQVYMGLAGLMIVEDVESDALDLPVSWGEDDIPLIIQDRKFKPDGSFDYLPSRQSAMQGMLGDVFLVNGAIDPVVALPAKEVRFRILNGSNARVYQLAMSDQRSFKLIAVDNSFVEAPVALTSITLSPGERAEIVVDLSSDLGGQLALVDQNNANQSLLTLDVSKVAAAATITSTPARLTTLQKYKAQDAVLTRTFSLGMRMGQFTINGQSMDLTRIDQVVPLNNIEIWEITNTMNMVHNFHTHATHFYILERNGSALNVKEYEQGYKDTVLLNPGDSVKVIIKMTDYHAASNTPYMFHCHILEHEDRGMMGQFTVV